MRLLFLLTAVSILVCVGCGNNLSPLPHPEAASTPTSETNDSEIPQDEIRWSGLGHGYQGTSRIKRDDSVENRSGADE